jgi:hypothetical protein
MKVSAEYITTLPISRTEMITTSAMLDITPHTTIKEMIDMAVMVNGDKLKCTDKIIIKPIIDMNYEHKS